MNRKSASMVAWSVGAFSISLIVGAIVLTFLDRHMAIPAAAASDRWNFSNVLNDIVNMAGAGIGIILASRRPENRIGWLFVGAGFVLGVNTFATAKGYGTGMQGMADRVAALGGELTVWSAPGEGTRVRATLPVLGPVSNETGSALSAP